MVAAISSRGPIPGLPCFLYLREDAPVAVETDLEPKGIAAELLDGLASVETAAGADGSVYTARRDGTRGIVYTIYLDGIRSAEVWAGGSVTRLNLREAPIDLPAGSPELSGTADKWPGGGPLTGREDKWCSDAFRKRFERAARSR